MTTNKFKSAQGHWITKQLFYEYNTQGDKCVYTLKEQDHKGYPSLKQIFLSIADPTEYRFATQALGGWTHWKRIKETSWFKPYYEEWVEELELKVMSENLARIMSEASDSESKNQYNANKYLTDKGWLQKEKKATGPRTKDKIQKEAKKMFDQNNDIKDDFERLGIHLVKDEKQSG